MKLLDLFCGDGGAGEGYRRAGFDVTGVDVEHHSYRSGTFILADAMEILKQPAFLGGFDAVHASPPCQAYSRASQAMRNAGKTYPDLLAPTREALERWGGLWVIENVPGAYDPKISELRDCMGIDWMNRDDLSQAIPPAYTQLIGEQLMDMLAAREVTSC